MRAMSLWRRPRAADPHGAVEADRQRGQELAVVAVRTVFLEVREQRGQHDAVGVQRGLVVGVVVVERVHAAGVEECRVRYRGAPEAAPQGAAGIAPAAQCAARRGRRRGIRSRQRAGQAVDQRVRGGVDGRGGEVVEMAGDGIAGEVIGQVHGAVPVV